MTRADLAYLFICNTIRLYNLRHPETPLVMPDRPMRKPRITYQPLPEEDLSWHPALSDSQKAHIKAGRARASIYQGVLIFEPILSVYSELVDPNKIYEDRQ